MYIISISSVQSLLFPKCITLNNVHVNIIIIDPGMSWKLQISEGSILKDSHTRCSEPYHQGFVSFLCSGNAHMGSRSTGAERQQQQHASELSLF